MESTAPHVPGGNPPQGVLRRPIVGRPASGHHLRVRPPVARQLGYSVEVIYSACDQEHTEALSKLDAE